MSGLVLIGFLISFVYIYTFIKLLKRFNHMSKYNSSQRDTSTHNSSSNTSYENQSISTFDTEDSSDHERKITFDKKKILKKLQQNPPRSTLNRNSTSRFSRCSQESDACSIKSDTDDERRASVVSRSPSVSSTKKTISFNVKNQTFKIPDRQSMHRTFD